MPDLNPRTVLRSALLVGTIFLVGAGFKLASFLREAFMAAKFGFSTATDAYFGLQQFPIMLASFMFGAFALAFTPAFAAARQKRQGHVEWLTGLLLLGTVVAAILTLLVISSAGLLLRILFRTAPAEGWSTLVILSVSFVPIIYIGIYAGMVMARGQSLWGTSLTGLPYLIMAITLPVFTDYYRLGTVSLPLSLSTGFALTGLISLVGIFRENTFKAPVIWWPRKGVHLL